MTAVKVHVKLRQQTCSIELAIGHEILIHFVYAFSVSKKEGTGCGISRFDF